MNLRGRNLHLHLRIIVLLIDEGGIIITAWMMELIEQFGYASIFVLIAMENVFPPLPSEIILAFGGFVTTYTKLTILGVIAAATAGSVVGAAILYKIGSILNAKKLDAVINRYGGILGLKVENMHKSFSLFRRYSYWAVFLCRMIPIMRSLISIPAGMSKMNFRTFLILTTTGTLIWNSLLVSAGALLGKSWEDVLDFIRVYQEITYLLLFLTGTAYIVLYYKVKRKRDN
jgi:membrane protein DedA with SNARE-associated domain